MQKILICLFVFLSSISFGATFQNSERDFVIRNPENTRNIKGNIAVIGNTVLCPKDRGGACTESANGQSNSDANLKYVNLYGPGGGWAGVGQVRRDTDTNKTGRVINTSTSHRTSKALDW